MMNKKLYRSNKDKMLGGVAGGLAEYFDIDTTIVRVVFIISLFLGGSGVLAYILMWIIVPESPYYQPEFKNEFTEKKEEETKNESQTSTANDFEKTYRVQKEQQRKKRSTFFGVALIILGFIFLADNWIPHLHFSDFFPIILIAIGIGFIVKSKK